MASRTPSSASNSPEMWPALPLQTWEPTRATLHMWMQIVGKISLRLKPQVNHWWQTAFHFNARGFTTNAMPYEGEFVEIAFDFVNHHLVISTSRGQEKRLPLITQSVADFYRDVMNELRVLGIEAPIWPMPVEIPDPIRFDRDDVHRTYDRDSVTRMWRILSTIEPIFSEFRGQYLGKSSPVHFFWGSFDVCETRFSGRRAPEREGADSITREAYSHEVISAGWWPGGGPVKGPAFYAYAAPEPEGFKTANVRPSKAFYSNELNEYLLMYDDVRTATDPRQELMSFLQSTYDLGSTLGNWDREALEVRREMKKAG